MVEGALTALKIKNSASHTEIKWNSRDELYIIETGARMGGDYISSDLVRLPTCYDFGDSAIKLAIGKFEVPTFPKHMHSGVFFIASWRQKLVQYHKTVTKLHTGSKKKQSYALDYLSSLQGKRLMVYPGHGDPFMLDEYNVYNAL